MKVFYSQKHVVVALLSLAFIFSSACGDEELAELGVNPNSAAEEVSEAPEVPSEENVALPEEGEEVKDWEGLEEGDAPMMAFAASSPSFPSLSTSAYATGYCRSTANDTYVYTSSALSTRGTSSPYKAYAATIYASDEVYFYSINTTWAYISYPVGSGRSYGYIRTKDCMDANYGESFTSKSEVTTYTRPNGGSYGKIYVGDSIIAVASVSGYYQVFYTAKSGNRAWKIGYVTQADYTKMKNGSGGGGSTSFSTWVNQTAAKTSPICNNGYCQCVALFNDYTVNFLRKSLVGAYYAYQLYNNAPTAQWTKLGASSTPQAGDVVIWKGKSGCGYGTTEAGHVGVVVSVQSNGQINVIHQNLSGDKSPRITAETKSKNLASSCLMGYLRPK